MIRQWKNSCELISFWIGQSQSGWSLQLHTLRRQWVVHDLEGLEEDPSVAMSVSLQ